MFKRFVGCAGWSLRKEQAEWFPAVGTHLQRYAQRFGAVEINSSFYRPHRHATYARWADSTPHRFRFAVKMPKQVTHLQRLVDADGQVERFVSEIRGLGGKLGAVLVQLPPSLVFDPSVAGRFFHGLRTRVAAAIVCEPRHRTWFAPEADALLTAAGISRVAADPAIVAAAGEPGGCPQIAYYRWHGSPHMYYSSYAEDTLRSLAVRMLRAAERAEEVWCIFDNTAEGAAQANAMQLNALFAELASDSQ